jgi:aminoglycoside phosphotransferase (APT) family kinase protein
MKSAELSHGLARFLSAKNQKNVEIHGLRRIAGGASRETWRFDAIGLDRPPGMIVRIDPTSSLIDTDRRIEFTAMRAAFLAGLTVPEPLDCVQATEWLGRSFSTSVEVAGQTKFNSTSEEARQKIACQKWGTLGQLARLNVSELELEDAFRLPNPASCASEQLEYWANVIFEDELHPNPVAHGAIRWLRRNLPPPPKKLCLVHGDYRTGNFLVSSGNDITAILDWEMAHIGDPLEDLAWSVDPIWSWEEKGFAGLLVPTVEAIGFWESASGMKVDPKAFHWWRVFVALKGLAIWISSSEAFHKGPTKNFAYALAGWLAGDRHQQILLDYLLPPSRRHFLTEDTMNDTQRS